MDQKIVIIGGGIAGIEAAKQLVALGLRPIIIEKSNRLGGHVADWHRLFPDMTEAKKIISGAEKTLSKAKILLNTTVQSINRLKDSYNVVLGNGVNITAKAVLISTGFKLFDAHKKEEYGYGVYDNVITNKDLELWMSSASSDVRGKGCEEHGPKIPANPRRIGFVHCVGSRDVKAGNSQCSKVCCMTAIKQAIELKERFPEAEIWCFYMDLRLFGKKYEDFYINAQKDYGIHFIRGRVSEVGETINGHLQVKAEDTLSGKPLKITLDMLVLMAGIVSDSSCTESLAEMLRLEVDSDGFLRSRDNLTGVTESRRPGIFFAGACTGAKTIPESIAEARAAALSIYNYIQGK